LLLLLVMSAGCSITRKFGDAEYNPGSDFPFITIGQFYLPSFSIGITARYRFEVRDLPEDFPEPRFLSVLNILSSHSGTEPPWKQVELRIQFLSTQGEILSAHHVGMKQYESGV